MPTRTTPRLLASKALRAFADGYVAVLLPVYLLERGLSLWQVGLLSTATLSGSALATLAVGAWGHRVSHKRLLGVAALLMLCTGLAFAGLSGFWPWLLVAFVGTLNPSSGDVSVFLPLEQALLAQASEGGDRTALFARYSLVGALFAACGALVAALPDALLRHAGWPVLHTLQALFALYGLVGAAVWWLYRGLPDAPDAAEVAPTPLGPSRPAVVQLAALFSLDSLAGGLVVNALLSAWLHQRFALSLTAIGTFFFWTGLLSAASQLAAPVLARRIGLLHTMVFTHIPASVCLMLAACVSQPQWALGLLLLRALLSQMDVPARSAFVMSVVSPAERAAAASFTAVPRSLASALSPTLGGAMMAMGWLAAPLLCCGTLKITYDLILWRRFQTQAHLGVPTPTKVLPS